MQSRSHELDFLKTPAIEHHQPLLTASQQSVPPPTDSKQDPSTPTHSPTRWFFMSWKFQLLSWLGSLVFFIATVIVLRVFDGKPLPQLRTGITPNAIVGLLATFTELLLVVPVNSAFGQLKWLRSLHAGPMDNFRVIDDASRGAWGSLVLLARRTGGFTASFGALVTILALGISTFTQQALRYDTIYPYSETSLLPVAQYLNGTGKALLSGGVTQSGVDPEVVSAAYTGLFSNEDAEFVPKASCGTSNCTWDSYQTLAICNTCEDLTPKLNRTKERISRSLTNERLTVQYNTNYYRLPGINFALTGTQVGASTVDETAIMNLTTSVRLDIALRSASVAFPYNGSKLLSVFVAGPQPGSLPEQPDFTNDDYNMTGTPFAPPRAYECLLQYCVRTHSAKFLNAVLNETTISTWVDQDRKQPLGTDHTDIVLSPPNSTTNFTITNTAWLSTQQLLATLLLGNTTLAHNPILNRDLDGVISSSTITQTIYNAMNHSSTGFPKLMDNLAASLSLNIRTMSYQPAPARGKAFSTESRAVVTWLWLILPALELLGSLLFLVAVMLESRKANLAPWVNNTLAYFFHGLDGRPPRAELAQSQDEMEREAKNLMMEFQPNHDGGRLVLVDKNVH